MSYPLAARALRRRPAVSWKVAGDGKTLPAVRRDHVAGFYDSDDDLVASVASFVVDGLSGGEGVVVVATAPHLTSLDAALTRRGIAGERFRGEGLLVTVDAHQALAALMVDGSPDRARFQEVIGDVVAEVAGRARRVRAFGEMVGVLWARGDVSGALSLESFSNDLGGVQDLSIWCAYPTTSLPDSELSAVAGLCAQHSGIVAAPRDEPDPVAAPPDGDGTTSRVFLPTPAAAAVRRFVRRALESWGATLVASDAAIVASELANNAILHAGSPFRVILSRAGARVTIAVADCDPTSPRRSHRGLEALGGRGIVIVAGVSERWGTEVGTGGKTVWATLTPGPTPAR